MPTLVILVPLIILAAIAMLLALQSVPRALEQRFADLALQVRSGRGALDGSEADSGGTARMLLHWAARRLPAPKADSPRAGRLAQTLAQAGYTSSNAPRMFAAVRLLSVIAMGALGLVGCLVMKHGAAALLGLGGGALLGGIVPSYYIMSRARRRQRAIANDLTDIIDLMVVAVEAGVGLHEAIKMVGADADRQGRPIGAELAQVSRELLAGATLGEALRAWANRTAVEDIKPLVATIIQSEQLGAQLGPALNAASDSLRAKRRLRAEEMAQKATVKILIPLAFLVLPAMMLVIIGPAFIQGLKVFK